MFFEKTTLINIISGTANGIVQIIISHPLDTIKINYQTNNKQNLNPFYLYKGFKYPFLTFLPIVTLQFTLESKLSTVFKNGYISGAITGFLVSPLVSLTDTMRIRKQKNIKEKLNLFRGLRTTSIRESLSISIYFGSYNFFKKVLNKHNIDTNINYMISGSIAGSLSWTLTYPIDVIKTRIQSYESNTITESLKMGNLWRGIYICNIRSVIINSIGFLVFENCKELGNKFLY